MYGYEWAGGGGCLARLQPMQYVYSTHDTVVVDLN